jgi:hypothetical protein
MNRLIQYDSAKVFPTADTTISDFYDKFSPEDYFIAVDLGGENIVGAYGPHDFYVLDFPGERAPNDRETTHEPLKTNGPSVQTNEEDLEEKKKKHKKDNTAGLHGVGFYQMTIGPSGDIDDLGGGEGGGDVAETTGGRPTGRPVTEPKPEVATKEESDNTFDVYKSEVLNWLATLDSGDKLIDATKTGRSDAFIKQNMDNGFDAEKTANSIRDHWYGV